MHVRAIALALPLLMGIACTHAEKRSSGTTSTSTVQSGQTASSETTSEPKTTQEGTTSPSSSDTGASATAQGGQTGTSQTGTTATTTEPRTSQESTASSSASGSDTAMGSSAGTAGATASKDPIIEEGDPVKAHADDEVVSGKIVRVTRRVLVIESDSGDQRSIFLVPETDITVDGQDAHRSDLQQGQDVRASYSTINGRDVAVKVRAGEDADAAKKGDQAPPDDPAAEMSSGSSSSFDTGASKGPSATPDSSTPPSPGR